MFGGFVGGGLVGWFFKLEIMWEPSNEFSIIFQSPCESGMVTSEQIYCLRNSSSKYCNQLSLYKMIVQYLSTWA